MEKLCLIISGGEYAPLPQELCAAEYVIACDRGYRYAERYGIVPDRIIGDFDSAELPQTKIPIDCAPTRKDDTDTMLAARHALEAGYREIAIVCAFGGRFDHAIANLQTGAFIGAHGGRARLVGADTDALVFEGGEVRIPRRSGWSLSLFSLSDRCEGVCVRGTKFVCEDVTVTNTFPVGVSNVWEADAAEVSAQSGILAVIQSKLRDGEHI